MGLLLYAGSGQFIAAGMIAASNPISAIIFTVFFINLRHLLLSAAVSPYFRHLPPSEKHDSGFIVDRRNVWCCYKSFTE